MGKLAALAIVAGFVAFYLALLLGGLAFVLFLLKNHRDAARYRALVREYEATKGKPQPAGPLGPTWKLTYKDGRATHVVELPGETETDALSAAAKQQIRWTSIVSLEKVA